MKKLILFVFVSLFLSCNAYKDIPMQNIAVGMSVSEVQEVVKKQMVKVAMSSDLEGDKEVYQVQKRIVRGGIARQQRFNIFFLNGKLVKYEKDSEQFSF
jgi:DNA-dependent RNA polymerase auxiliary subunit epsilon